MNIVLIQPDVFLKRATIDSGFSEEYKRHGKYKKQWHRTTNRKCELPPLGLGYVAAYLLQDGHTVHILDAHTLELNLAETVEECYKLQPDLIGISFYTPNRNEVYHLARALKEQSDTPLVLGGPDPSIEPAEVVKEFPFADYVMSGESELSVVQLVNALEGKIPLSQVSGLHYRQDGEMVSNGPADRVHDLDDVLLPARHLLDDMYERGLYFTTLQGRLRVDEIITSRGCPYRCNYCFEGVAYYKWRSAENIMTELRQLAARGVQSVEIMDSNFALNKKRANDLFDMIIDEKLQMKFRCRSVTNVVEEDLWRKMKRAGVYAVSFGMEAGNATMMKAMNKTFTSVEKNERACRITKKVGMKCLTTFLLGCPGETPETIEETKRFVKRIKPDTVNFNMLYPLPGTEQFNKHKHLIQGSWAVSQDGTRLHPWIPLPWCKDRKEFQRLVKAVETDILISPHYLFKYALENLRHPNRRMLRYARKYIQTHWKQRIGRALVSALPGRGLGKAVMKKLHLPLGYADDQSLGQKPEPVASRS
jgi:anaerobic magnesium-protoporphyrin IX monomethyl ester cyclase